MDVIEILSKLVSFNTIEDLENDDAINWIEKYLNDNGFKCKRITDDSTKKQCLIAQIGEEPILGFSGHLDTVNYNQGWNTNPFKLEIIDNKAYGLGACDMKSGIAAFLKACSLIDNKNLKNGIKIYFTFDEEINFDGIKLLNSINEQFPKYLILCESTDLKPIVATKGCMEIQIEFFGKSTHSSTPDKGKNAIVEAYRFIGQILELSDKLKEEENKLFSVPYTTINIGKICGGDAVNKVPDKCIVNFDARTINSNHNYKIKKILNEIIKSYDCKMDVKLDILPNINNNAEMIYSIESICNSKSGADNYVTEASFIKGSQVIILGAGPNTAHQCNEYVDVDKVNKLVKIYGEIIDKYCF